MKKLAKLQLVLPKLKFKITAYAIPMLVVLVFAVYSVASDTAGTIDSEIKYAWSENAGWLNFGDDNGNVEVTDLELTGYAWSENLGWISLNCSDGDVCDTSDYKISNDAEGNLSGYAWSENTGWINFAPADGGVSINSDGEFSGLAWGENIGWIAFSCEDLDACDTSSFRVKTDWRPLSARADDGDDNDGEDDLEISDVSYFSTDTTITVKWETNHKADSRVIWGTDKNLQEEKKDSDKKEKHKVILKDLQSNTSYYFRVKSVDKNDQSDRSRIYSVTTKKAATFFTQRPYSNPDQYFLPEETLEVKVSDEKPKAEEIQKEAEAAKQEKSPTKGEWKIFAWTKTAFASGGKFFTSAYISLKNIAVDLAFSVKNSFLAAQKKMQKLADNWQKKKEIEVAQITEDGQEVMRKIEKYYSTRVFKKDGVKKIAEVKFQLLDKKERPLAGTKATLFSDPQTVVSDGNGVAAFKDVPIGEHTLAFSNEGKEFKKKVAIADMLTEEGLIRAEIVQVKAQKEKLAWWMWSVIAIMLAAVVLAGYFGKKYYALKNKNS